MADWSQIEVDLIVADYFSMLIAELSGYTYNKSVLRRNLVKVLNKRSEGSIEFKHQNISAVLIRLGLPFIKGYKPLYNYQRILEERVIDYLNQQKELFEPKFRQFADEDSITNKEHDFSNFVDVAPPRQKLSELEKKLERKPFKINYLEREQNNISLGEQGEILVIEYEKWNLKSIGTGELANKIKWVSKSDDGAGFDILSKNLDGSDKFIEVKTTKLSKETPIFFSKNEYEFSKENSDQYYLYRVFNFNSDPRLFFLKGNFDLFCNKEAVQYKGWF